MTADFMHQPQGAPVRPVLHLIDSLDCGGAQQLLVELAKATPRDLHPTSVAVIQPTDGLADRLEALGVRVHRLGRERASIVNPLKLLKYFAGTLADVVRLCRREKIAILHCHLSDAEFIGILAGRLARTPHVLDTVHTPMILPKRSRLDPRNLIRSWLAPRVLNLADWVITVSGETADVLADMGVDREKLRVVENGVAVEDDEREPDPGLRASLGLDGATPVIASVARLTPVKGHVHLLRAMPAVLAAHPGAKLLLLGEGELRGELEAEIDRLGLAGSVLLLGVRSDVREILRLSDVFVLPSLKEGTSLALLEAMAVARPIVATDIEGNRSLMRHESNCLLVPPADDKALAGALSRLLEDKPLGRALGVRARADMEASHGVKAMLAAYEELWSSKPGQGGRRPLRVAVMGLRGIPATWGGVEHQCEQLYSRLADMGFDVTVYARKGYVDPGVKRHKSVNVVCLPTIPTKHLEAIVHTFLAVLHAGFRRFDIWHIYSQGPFLCSPLAKLMRPRRPLFFTCGGLDWQRRKWTGPASLAIALGEWLSARLADRIVVVSRALGDYYRKRYNADSLCIVNGVDIPGPTPLDKAPGLGLGERGYVLFVGRLVPEKRIEDLIRAVRLSTSGVKLVVAGGGAAAGEYEAMLRTLAGDDPRVVLAGYRYGEELAALYSNALGYVTASELEGLPLTLLEAMSHGLPCIASGIPPHREVLDGLGEDVFPVHGVEELARLMDALAALSEDARQARGERCREHVRLHYSWDQAARMLAGAYGESLARPA